MSGKNDGRIRGLSTLQTIGLVVCMVKTLDGRMPGGVRRRATPGVIGVHHRCEVLDFWPERVCYRNKQEQGEQS
jgi:hypothetical protein